MKLLKRLLGKKEVQQAEKPPITGEVLADDVGNVPRLKGYSQVCLWPGFTIVDPEHPDWAAEEHVKRFRNWMDDNFSVRVQFLEEIAIKHAGGEVPFIVFALHSEDVPKFVIPRLHFGIRWIEDATDPGNGPPLPQRFLGYRMDRQ